MGAIPIRGFFTMVKILERMVEMARPSPGQHILAGIGALNVALGTQGAADFYAKGNEKMAGVCLGLALVATMASAVHLYASRRLERDYQQVQGQLAQNGWAVETVEPWSHTWGERQMVLEAACSTGHERQTRAYLTSQGHRWYHFHPDYLVPGN